MGAPVRAICTLVLALVLARGCGGGPAAAPPDAAAPSSEAGAGLDAAPDAIDVAAWFGDPVLNPTEAAPLVGEIPFHPPGDVTVTIAVADLDDGEAPFAADLDVAGAAGVVQLPIVGLFPAADNQVSFTVRDASGATLGVHAVTLTTGPAPTDFPSVVATGDHDPTRFTLVEWLRTPLEHIGTMGFMVDRRGRLRWYSAFPDQALEPMEDFGGILYAGDGATHVLAYDVVGHELMRQDFGALGFKSIHHDIFRRADGDLVLTVTRTDAAFIEDRIIEIDPVSGALVAQWDLTTTFPDVAGLFYDVPMTDQSQPGITNNPVHNNAAWVDDADDTLIACSQRSGVAKLSRAGLLLWFLAPQLIRWIDDANHDGVSDSLAAGYDPNDRLTWVSDFTGPAFVDERYPVDGQPTSGYAVAGWSYGDFMLMPLDASGAPITDESMLRGLVDHPQFAWPFRPHAARLASSGNLLVFDNGLGRNFGLPFTTDSYSRAVEYVIVPDATTGYGGTVQQVWEYRVPADPSWWGWSPICGGVVELPGGTRLVTSGALGSSYLLNAGIGPTYDGPIGAVIIEVDPRDNSERHRLSLARVVDAGHPVPEFSAYRATRIDPYERWRGRPLGAR